MIPKYGANYYPLVDNKDNWHRDMKLYQEANVDYIRTAEIFNTWDTLEPIKDEFHFEELSKYMDVANEYGIKVLLGTGSNSAPYWMHLEEPAINIVNSNGMAFPNHGTYGWACYNNPFFQTRHAIYLESLINYFKNHPALMGYQINNEIGYPFMPGSTNQLESYCYCESCKKLFREWLILKYKDIDKLNVAWRWSTTNTNYLDWYDIEPPYVKPANWASLTRWLDWRLFQMDSITNQVKRENLQIKKLDNTKPTITNIFYMKSQDPLATITALDQFEIAKHTDIIGYDLYPGSGDKLESKPEFSSMFLDHGLSVAYSVNKKIILSEVEGGPIGGFALGPDRNTSSEDIIHNQVQAFGKGIKSVLYQLFKPYPFQPLHWGSIITHDGEKTIRYEDIKDLGQLVKSESSFIEKAQRNNVQIGLLISKRNDIILNSTNESSFYLDELRGIYKYYNNQNYEIIFITEEMFLANNYPEIKLLHVPYYVSTNSALELMIKEKLDTGLNIILSTGFGYYDESAWLANKNNNIVYTELLGIRILDIKAKCNASIYYQNNKLCGYWHQESIKVINDKTKVLAYYNNELPAVIINEEAAGDLIYFTTHPGNEIINGSGLLYKGIMDNYLARKKILPYLELDYFGFVNKEIEAYYLDDGCMSKIYITSFNNQSNSSFYYNNKRKFRLKINNKKVTKLKDNYNNIEYRKVNNNDLSIFNLEITKGEPMILEVIYD